MSAATLRLLSVSARLIGFVAALLAIVPIMIAMFFYFYSGSTSNVGLLPIVIVVQALLAVWVVRRVFSFEPGSLFCVLLLAFVGSFIGSFRWYLLLLPALSLNLIEAGNFLRLVAAALVAAPVLKDARRSRIHRVANR